MRFKVHYVLPVAGMIIGNAMIATGLSISRLRDEIHEEWLPAFQQELKIETAQLPILWDADFLLGPKTAMGEDTYVLCEINISSVAPFPDSTVAPMAQAQRLPHAR